MTSPIDRLIVALDYPTLPQALALVETLGDTVARYKVGLELFGAVGPAAVRELLARDKRVFLDLKLHDIPETVRRAAGAAAHLGAELITVHAAGGAAMLRAAVDGARVSARTQVLAVTVLTSLSADDLAGDGIAASVEEQVVRRARLAAACGCAGVIASPLEVSALREVLPSDFAVVTPGVRFGDAPSSSSPSDDQKRTARARDARRAGADAVVVGRPIRDAADPRAAAAQLLAELI